MQKAECDKMAKIEFSLSQAKTSLPLPLAWTYVLFLTSIRLNFLFFTSI